jgi:hypothetical protein
VAPVSSLEIAPSSSWNAASDPSCVSLALQVARARMGPPFGELRTQTTWAAAVDAQQRYTLAVRRNRAVGM